MLLPEQLKLFARFIESELGIVYSEANYFQLQSRLDEITSILGLKDVQALFDLARNGFTGQLKQCLLDRATNNETSFFRDPKIFTAISRFILPELMRTPRTLPIRIWSAASSFGQEPYTLAMLCHELMETNPSLKVEIIATDISERALKRASEGVYSQLEVQRGLSAKHLVKYFEKSTDDYWKVRPIIRRLVEFRQQNLLHSFSQLGTFDLVLCRNVLIYQSVENKREILARLAQSMSSKSFILLGAGESLLGLSDHFTQAQFEGAFFYQPSAQPVKKAA